MRFSVTLSLGVLVALTSFSPTLAAPTGVKIEDRDLSSPSNKIAELQRRNVIQAHLDCTGIEELCDANCFAILCENQPQVLVIGLTHRDLSTRGIEGKKNYRESGAEYGPFNKPAAMMQKIGVTRPDANHNSAEEYPFKGSVEGGRGANLFPVTRQGQSKQGGKIRAMLDKYKVMAGDMYMLNFDNANTPYCTALKNGDYSVCSSKKKGKGPWGFDFGDFDYERASLKGQPFQFTGIGKQHILGEEANEVDEDEDPESFEAFDIEGDT